MSLTELTVLFLQLVKLSGLVNNRNDVQPPAGDWRMRPLQGNVFGCLPGEGRASAAEGRAPGRWWGKRCNRQELKLVYGQKFRTMQQVSSGCCKTEAGLAGELTRRRRKHMGFGRAPGVLQRDGARALRGRGGRSSRGLDDGSS
jgi:hypothetical protein